jgi:5-methylcytosine-specific restriction endonuclease McrA
VRGLPNRPSGSPPGGAARLDRVERQDNPVARCATGPDVKPAAEHVPSEPLSIGNFLAYFMPMEPLVLTVDMAGLPQAWVALEEAITYHAKQMVAWSLGREVREFRGGWQRNGERSRIATKSILAIKGTGAGSHIHAPGLTNSMLFARDRQLCAYCGKRFLIRDLSRDHVVPVSRGGRDSWTNTVTSCRSCNTRKGGRSPEQASMPLLYVPYVPNRHEHFILRNRRILADQMEYLLAGVPRTSRLHSLKDAKDGARLLFT